MQANKTYVCSFTGCGETFTVLFDWTRHVRKHAAMRQTAIGISSLGPRTVAEKAPYLQSTTQRLEMPTAQMSVALPFVGSTQNTSWASTPSLAAGSASTAGESLSSSDTTSAKPPNVKQSANITRGSPGTKGRSPRHSSSPPIKASDALHKARSIKKSETRPGLSELLRESSSLRKQLPVPTSTPSMEQPKAVASVTSPATRSPATRSPGLSISSSATPPITPTRMSPKAILEEQAQGVNQSLQELQLDTGTTGEHAPVSLPTSSATPTKSSAPTISVPQSASSTPPTSVQDQAEEHPHEIQADTEGSDKHIDTDVQSNTSDDAESIEVDIVEISHDNHEQEDDEEDNAQSDAIQSCAIRDLASKWPACTTKVKGKGKRRPKVKTVQLTMSCDADFESSIDEITHYLEHFAMTGPYLDCPIPTCRMIFVLENQLEEHKTTFHSKTSPTLPPRPPSPKPKQTKNSPTEAAATARTKGRSSHAVRMTRSQAKIPARASTRPKAGKAEKAEKVDFSDGDVPLKLLGPFKK